MRHPLTPFERAALRRIEAQLREESPRLAARLSGRGRLRRPGCWRARVLLLLGVLFLASGFFLGVVQAVLGGAAALVLGGVLSARCRRTTRSVLWALGYDGPPPRPTGDLPPDR